MWKKQFKENLNGINEWTNENDVSTNLLTRRKMQNNKKNNNNIKTER